MLPDALRATLEQTLGTPLQSATAVGGGCIAHATRLDTAAGRFFLKYGEAEVARTFPAEARGLRALAAADALVIPEVIAQDAATPERPGYLVLSWIEPGPKTEAFWTALGEGLAQLHRVTGAAYGDHPDNVIGRLPQANPSKDDWPAFFRTARLAPQVQRARANGRWQAAWDAPLDALYRRLPELLPFDPPPSRLHGDLWSGNVLATADGRAALIDPAVYHGHRAADVAMTELFGGFEARFYEAYNAAWPLRDAYAQQRPIYNLYHLINHLNHFGTSYAARVARILQRFE
ncbi:fructosamine kinase family protein [Salisaeta longa]|uniref:fructosamine kinase family protein n=1 Tax=Salisaeta longa TaxID=503170 RepID=UPI0003B3F3F0|nr:fructosamine kinase family protein [Salisaeta longa]